MPEREGFFKKAIEKLAEVSKKIDVILIGSGVAIFIFASGVGAALIIGSTITIIPAELAKRWAKKQK